MKTFKQLLESSHTQSIDKDNKEDIESVINNAISDSSWSSSEKSLAKKFLKQFKKGSKDGNKFNFKLNFSPDDFYELLDELINSFDIEIGNFERGAIEELIDEE